MTGAEQNGNDGHHIVFIECFFPFVRLEYIGDEVVRGTHAFQCDEPTLALAAAELLGDNLHSAPERIIAPGILARTATGAIAGAAVAPSRDRNLGAAVGATVAVGAVYLTLALRNRAIRYSGQTSTGLIEDTVALGIDASLAVSAYRLLRARHRRQ